MMRNRLFWKIFASIWLALALTIGGVTAALIVHNRARFEEASRLVLNPRAGFANRVVAAIIEGGGEAPTRRLLELLAINAGQSVSKEDLCQHALGRPLTRYDRSIDVHVSNLRHKLGLLDDGRSPVQTVRGIGYQLILV